MDAVRPALPGLSPVEPVASFCEPHGSCENQHFGEIGTAHMMFNPALNTIWDDSARFGR